MSKVAAEVVAGVRKRCLRRAHRLEKLAHEQWRDEALLAGLPASEASSEAAELEADLGCICVDLLHPAVTGLRKAGEPRRRPEAASENTATSHPENQPCPSSPDAAVSRSPQ